MKCLVKKLGVSIENDDLPVFVDNLKSQITVLSDNSYIRIVGNNLPVTSFRINDVTLEVTFNGKNNATIGDLINGFIEQHKRRLYFAKPYKANSQGEVTYNVECYSGNGEQTITDTIALEKEKDVICKFKGKNISLNDTVYTQPAYDSSLIIDSLTIFGQSSRKDMFLVKSVKITDNTTNNVILEAYPALNNGNACLYDVVNNVYYEGTGDFEVE